MSSSKHGFKGTTSMAGSKNRPQDGLSVNKSRFNKTITSSRSTNIGGTTSSKKSVAGEPPKVEKKTVIVLDESGNDVTPHSLLIVDPTIIKKNQSNIFGSSDSAAGTPTDMMSQPSIYQTATASVAGQFSRSMWGGVSSSHSGRSTPDSFADELTEPGTVDTVTAGLADVLTKHEIQEEEITEEILEQMVDITLVETDTIWLLDLAGVCIPADSEEAPEIKAANDRYKELLKNRVGNDRYQERGMQTFNEFLKHKEIQTSKISTVETGVMATNWDMFDSYAALEPPKKKEVHDDEEDCRMSRPVSAKKEAGMDERKLSDVISGAAVALAATPGAGRESQASMTTTSGTETDSVFAASDYPAASSTDASSLIDDSVLKSDAMKTDLFIMERVVTGNIYQPKQAAYRGLPILADVYKHTEESSEISEPQAPRPGSESQLRTAIERLWTYGCALTKGRNVSCISWNKLNHDLLAVGYGQFNFTENQKSGVICCWSMKNPEYPERVYTTKVGVTAVDFSSSYPNLLAVGLYDGTVEIYNVRRQDGNPILDSFESPGKHTAPVWQLKWVDREKATGEDRGENLVSIAADGRVTLWSLRKGFEYNDMMKLKRVLRPQDNKGKEGKKGEAFISRYAPGMCFDFSEKDPNMYLAGTDDGHIHRCSCSYNEQYLDSYFGHTGPVYKVIWSPFLPDVFLSCSADWTVRLWYQEKNEPVLTFQSSTKQVNDVCWSPHSPTVFGCVNEGAIEIWDLNVNTLDPIIVSVPVTGTKLTSIRFSTNSQSILVGDSDGQVMTFLLHSMPAVESDQADKLSEIIKTTVASQTQAEQQKKIRAKDQEAK